MSNRAVIFAALLLTIGGLWACWCDTAMIWDGAYQFCISVNAGRAFAYLSRFHSWVVWQPVIWLSQHTENLRLLRMVYGAPYCFAPLMGVLLSWWIVRRQAPHLVLWAILGCALGSLPGQIFMINDSIFQMHLYWPVLFATFLPLSRGQLAVMLPLSLFQTSHPIGVGVCAMTSIAALAFARWGRPDRQRALLGWALWWGTLAVASVAKLLVWRDAYAGEEASPHRIWMTFRWGVLWWPFFAVLAAWAVGFLLAWSRGRPESTLARRTPRIALGLLLFAGVCLIYWACQPVVWQTAHNYRRWLLPMLMPFIVLAGWELWQWHRASSPEPSTGYRGTAAIFAAAIFLVVLGIQSATWNSLYQRLAKQIAAHPSTWITEPELAWTRESPMAHWGLQSQIILVQGRTPRVLLWSEDDDRATREEPPRFAFSPFNYLRPTAVPRNWFDWSVLLRDTRAAGPR